jgi:hypothetical protein
VQSFPPYSAAIYTLLQTATNTSTTTDSTTTRSFEQRGASWVREQWVTSSKKTAPSFGPNVHPLPIHRGTEGTLKPLITAASSSRARFVSFAQVPLVTTLDGNANWDPVEIIHLEPDTVFAAAAWSADGTHLAIADNRQDIIVLRRTKQAANAQAPAVEDNDATKTKTNRTKAAAHANLEKQEEQQSLSESAPDAQQSSDGTPSQSSPSPDVPADSAAAPGTPSPDPVADAAPSAVAPAAPIVRRRHQWEVLYEVTLPRALRKLALMAVHVIEVPVPAEVAAEMEKDAQATVVAAAARAGDKKSTHAGSAAKASSSASSDNPAAAVVPTAAPASIGVPSIGVPSSTPVLLLLFQGGVMATMQLTALSPTVGHSAAAAAAAPPSSMFDSHFHHPVPEEFGMDMLRAFLHVHWDLLLSPSNKHAAADTALSSHVRVR